MFCYFVVKSVESNPRLRSLLCFLSACEKILCPPIKLSARTVKEKCQVNKTQQKRTLPTERRPVPPPTTLSNAERKKRMSWMDFKTAQALSTSHSFLICVVWTVSCRSVFVIQDRDSGREKEVALISPAFQTHSTSQRPKSSPRKAARLNPGQPEAQVTRLSESVSTACPSRPQGVCIFLSLIGHCFNFLPFLPQPNTTADPR